MNVRTIEHTDVKGKVLKYLEIGNGKGESYLINVGDKTYNAVKKLVEEGEIEGGMISEEKDKKKKEK